MLSGRSLVANYTTSITNYIHGLYLPIYTDLEGDNLQISFRDDTNHFLNLYTVPFDKGFIDKSNGFLIRNYEVRSETIIEDYNAVVGNSTVTVTWSDSFQSVSQNFTLQILTLSEYNRRVQSGDLSTETVKPKINDNP